MFAIFTFHRDRLSDYKLSFSPPSFPLLPVMVYYFAIMLLLAFGRAAPCTGPVHSIKIPGSIQSILSEILSETCKWTGTIVFGTGLLSLAIKSYVTTFLCRPCNYCSWNKIDANKLDCIVHVHLPVEKLATRKISKKKRTVKFQNKFQNKFKAMNHLPFIVGWFKLMKSVSLLCLVMVVVMLVPVVDASGLDMMQYKNSTKQKLDYYNYNGLRPASNVVDGDMATFSHTGKMVKIYRPGGSGGSDTSNDVFESLLFQQPPTNSTIRVNPILFHHNKSNATSSRPRFIRNDIVNKWFNSDVNSASRQQERFEAFRSELKYGKYFKNKTIECIEMYLCFLAMGCFLTYLGVNVIPWVCLDIYFYFRKRRNEKKIIKFKRKRGFSEKIKGKEMSAGKSRWTYTNRLGTLFSNSLVLLCLVALFNVLEGVDAYDKMPDGCKFSNSWLTRNDRACYPRKAVDELIALNADGSGTHATYGPMKDWDMSLVTDISSLFYQKGTMNADLSSWDVSSVTNMYFST